MSRPSQRPTLAASLAAVLLACTASAGDRLPPPPRITEVKVERDRPPKDKISTLTFLRANRDFIRSRYDRLVVTPLARGGSDDCDPRFMNYADLLGQVSAARDTAGAAEDERARRNLIQSIAQLGALENELDRVERLLAAQRTRLAILEDDFTGRQLTTLLVVLKGFPSGTPVREIELTRDDGTPLRVALSPEQRESLRHGGLLEVFHGAVEPRLQVVQVTLFGPAWESGSSGFMTLDPLRDRLTFLRLDLSGDQPAQGGASIQASTWLHEAPAPSVDRGGRATCDRTHAARSGSSWPFWPRCSPPRRRRPWPTPPRRRA
jgi:hypothetical protein